MRAIRETTPWIAIAALLAAGCGGHDDDQASSGAQPATPEPAREEQAPRPVRDVVGDKFEALPAETEVNHDKMVLGRRLFHDTALSGDNTVSCATCHSLSHGGAEDRRTSTGIRGQTGPINAPTVLNSRYNFVQFWDGRAANLLEQAAGPIGNPIEMDGDWTQILERLRGDDAYVQQFTSVYGEDGITQEHALDAIVAYEDYLVTPSRFDRWLRGDDSALTEAERAGLRTFVDTGCPTCHRGRNVGGSMYQKMGLVHDYFEERGGPQTDADAGRFNVTHEEEDRHQFKVPTLRNVALTAPYFHDGSQRELAGAVRTMAHVQLGRELTDDQVGSIVTFLNALTGELPAEARMPGAAGAEQGETTEGEGATAPAAAESASGEGAAPAQGATAPTAH